MEFYKDGGGMPISWVNPVRKDGALTPPSIRRANAFYLYHPTIPVCRQAGMLGLSNGVKGDPL
jgi:hypothetical protein